MGVHVVGIRDLSKKAEKMIAVKLACDAAGVDYPEEVKDYLKYPGESLEYIRQELEEIDLDDCLKPWTDDVSEGYEIDVASIPGEAKTIRFYFSW